MGRPAQPDLLRFDLRGVVAPGGAPTPRALLGWGLVGGALYGAVMGSYGGVVDGRGWQVVFAALKVPLLLGVTFAICLPAFFVLSSLLGLRRDFGRVLRALVRAQAAVAVCLAAFAPYTAFVYASGVGYGEALLFNAAAFGAASLTAQLVLRRDARPWIRQDRRHVVALRVWLVLYAFVGVQLGWVLRPFVGSPGGEVAFFRGGAWGNAYVVVARLVAQALGG